MDQGPERSKYKRLGEKNRSATIDLLPELERNSDQDQKVPGASLAIC